MQDSQFFTNPVASPAAPGGPEAQLWLFCYESQSTRLVARMQNTALGWISYGWLPPNPWSSILTLLAQEATRILLNSRAQ